MYINPVEKSNKPPKYTWSASAVHAKLKALGRKAVLSPNIFQPIDKGGSHPALRRCASAEVQAAVCDHETRF